MTASPLYPIQVLREHVTALEAALSVCLAEPDGKPVHRLRTETRRVEALLLLLEQIPSLPEHRKPAERLVRSLKKLRRAAGDVRDLDVHRKLLEGLAVAKEVEDSPEKQSSAEDRKADPQQADAAVLRDAAEELRDRLGRKRAEAARDLQDLLGRQQVKAARAAETLLQTLHPATDFALPGADLLRNADLVLTRDGLLQKAAKDKLSDDELHTVRKAAKRARYLAETLPDDPVLAEAAQHFEALQELGGHWHDALELAHAARQHFGKGHVLTALYRAERDGKRELYRVALQSRAAEMGKAPESSSATKRRSGAEGKGRKPKDQSAALKGVRRSAPGRATRSVARQKTAA